MGFQPSFGRHAREMDAFSSTTVAHRLADLQEAWRDPSVHALLTVIGGFNKTHLLRGLDYDLIRSHPKVLCGYSDITALQNAIFARTGVVTYSGPHFVNFGDVRGADYTVEQFRRCLFDSSLLEVPPSVRRSEDRWWRRGTRRHFPRNPGPWTIQEGPARGTVIGGNLCTLNLLQGTGYLPDLGGTIPFIEDEDVDGIPVYFDRNLESLLQQPGADRVRGLVIGRSPTAAGLTPKMLAEIVRAKPELKGIPVVAGLDFGHTTPMFTFPIGGTVDVQASGKMVEMAFLTH